MTVAVWYMLWITSSKQMILKGFEASQLLTFVSSSESLMFVWTGFGASASLDNGPSDQNGYPKNKHLRAAHQQLDSNLGEKHNVFSHTLMGSHRIWTCVCVLQMICRWAWVVWRTWVWGCSPRLTTRMFLWTLCLIRLTRWTARSAPPTGSSKTSNRLPVWCHFLEVWPRWSKTPA